MYEEYLKAKRMGDRSVRQAVFRGEYPYLVSLSHILPNHNQCSRVSVGLMEIPLSLVKGTVTEGRQNAFSRDFLPILKDRTEFCVKWSTLLEAHFETGIRDAIQVIEYMNRFYVLEGNKRVSVLKYVGADSVLADVQRILPARSEDKEVRVYYEFLEYFRVTRLFEPFFSERGCYELLAEKYGESLEREWDPEVTQTLRSNFRSFLAAFQARGGDALSITAGDGFLLYLGFYSRQSLSDDGRAEIDRKLAAIWQELVSASNADAIARIEDPEPVRSSPILNLGGLFNRSHSRENPLKVAFIYSGTPEESRWIYAHELGRQEMEESYEGLVETVCFENCRGDDQLDEAFRAAAESGMEVVFTISPAMMDASMRAAVRYPDLKILNCSINLTSSRVRTYYPKMYEAKMLMGALAASFSQDHRIGYVADYPIYGSMANINAFAIGVGLIDPHAKIYLKWSGKMKSDWEAEMEAEGLTTISGPDSIRPKDASRKYGVYQQFESYEVQNLAAPIYHWSSYYRIILDSILSGAWASREQVSKNQAVNYWFGMSAGVVDVIFSDKLPYYSRKLMHLMRDGILADAIHPFRGEVHSQKGTLSMEGAPEFLSDQIITMNWLNDNILGEIPGIDELKPSIRETIRKSGVEQEAL